MSEKIIGVYKISNVINKKYYIGYSKDVSRRWREHKRKFKNGCHDNSYFQNSYKKYGEENFVYELIHKCNTIDEAKKIELTYLENKLIRNELYNLNYDNKTDGHFDTDMNK